MRQISRFFGKTFIKPWFQLKYILLTLFFCELMVLTVWYAGQFVVLEYVYSDSVQYDYIFSLLRALNGYVVSASLITACVILILSALVSNGMAGPIYRIEKVMEKVAKGDLRLNVTIRKHDEFQETAKVMDQALKQLRERIRHEQAYTEGLYQKIVEIQRKRKANKKDPEIDPLLENITKPDFKLKI